MPLVDLQPRAQQRLHELRSRAAARPARVARALPRRRLSSTSPSGRRAGGRATGRSSARSAKGATHAISHGIEARPGRSGPGRRLPRCIECGAARASRASAKSTGHPRRATGFSRVELFDYRGWPRCRLHSPRAERMTEKSAVTPSARSVHVKASQAEAGASHDSATIRQGEGRRFEPGVPPQFSEDC